MNCKAKATGINVGCWNKSRAPFESLESKVGEIEIMLIENSLDILGICEANFKAEDTEESVAIPGYDLVWEPGREHDRRKNARVVVYVKSGIHVTLRTDLMEADLIPTVWLAVGPKGTKQALACFMYQEWKKWKIVGEGGPDEGPSPTAQALRWREWLIKREPVFNSTREVWLLGDINLDISKQPAFGTRRLLEDVQTYLTDKGWSQLIKGPTRYEHTVRGEKESMLDLIFTNMPEKIARSGKTMCSSSDHALIWMHRMTKALEKSPKKTLKRSFKNYQEADLKLVAEMTDWGTGEQELEGGTVGLTEQEVKEKELEAKVMKLENNIRECMQVVAPMKIISLKKKKAAWITDEILEQRRYRERLRAKARRSNKEQDFKKWKDVRKLVARLVKDGKKKHLETGLYDQLSNSASAWRGIKSHLGWDTQVGPEALVVKRKEGKVNLEKLLNKPSEVAEEMVRQYEAKNEEVKEAIGPPVIDYLARLRRLTAGNCGKFDFIEVTEKDVKEAIKKVDDKESFGVDQISYGCLKKLIDYVTHPLTEIINMSIQIAKYPRCWTTARIKPIWKGKGNNKNEAKSFRPVALLPACGRIMEGLLARQVDKYAQERSILHDSVHGFRSGHGTDTALAEVWEYVLGEVEKGNIVALCLLDVSAGFDSVPHINMLRKLEMYGYGDRTLRWLGSYVDNRKQFVVVEDKDSRKYSLDRGIPQGGPLCPNLWREYVNDLPEEVMKWGGSLLGEDGAERPSVFSVNEESSVSRIVDNKTEEECTAEELFDKRMRNSREVQETRAWRIEEVRRERTGVGPDQLRVKKKRDPDDGKSTIYADDSSILTSGSTWTQLEGRMHSSLRPTFNNMKASRLKVNEGKTEYILIASNQRRLASGGLEVVTTIGGKMKKPQEAVKSLGVLISSDLTWKHQTKSKLKECQSKLKGLYSIQKQVPIERRKELATGVICSRLGYALETVSTGRMKDLEALQSMKVKAARWVLGARRLGWSTTRSFKKLGWLTMQQEVTYKTVRMALKVLQTQQPRFLHEKITTSRLINKNGEWHEVRDRRKITKEELDKLKLSTRKSWAVRASRWMEQIPQHLFTLCVKKDMAKKKLKAWCMENIPTTGDRILRGKSLEEGRTERRKTGDEEENNPEGGQSGLEKGQQRLMKNWLRGQGQHQGKEGRKGQAGQQANIGNQKGEKPQSHHPGKEEERHQNREKVKEHEQEKQEKEEKQPQKKEQQERRAEDVIFENSERRHTVRKEKPLKRKIASWLTTMLLLFRNRGLESSQEEKTTKCRNIEEDSEHQESGSQRGSRAGVGKRTRTGIG